MEIIYLYQGTNAVIKPNTIIVTEAPHIAVLRPNLSDTSPEQKDPRAKPGREKVRLDGLHSDLRIGESQDGLDWYVSNLIKV